jgi:hypothetical protein
MLAAIVPAAALAAGMAALTRDPAPRPDVSVRIASAPASRPIPPGFVGLSLEFPAVLAYTGAQPGVVDPVFLQLVRNLAPGQSPVLRIGGDSTDGTWWRVRGHARPGGVSYTLSPLWLQNTRTLAQRLRAHLILGIELEANQPALSGAEARAFLAGIGRRSIEALEIGNEPNRYTALPWYHSSPRHPVFGRHGRYDFGAFAADFARVRRALPAVPLAGPTVGGFDWLAPLRGFLAAEPRLAVVTLHRYPLNRCFTLPRSPTYPTVAKLLAPRTSRGLAAGIAPYAALAHRHRVGFRVDEMQSVACGGKRGVSNTFAAALWALDTLFSLAGQGVDGVNVHTFPDARYQLFSFRHAEGRRLASVSPEYYGLAMFARAAPPGSRLLPVQVTGAGSALRAWATRARDGRWLVLLINDDTSRRHVVAIAGPPRARATLERLSAPSAWATSGATLGGRRFDPATGALTGPPRTEPVTPSAGRYTVALAPMSAALLTVR